METEELVKGIRPLSNIFIKGAMSQSWSLQEMKKLKLTKKMNKCNDEKAQDVEKVRHEI